MRPEDILSFWFVEHGPDDWFSKSDAFDALIRERFGAHHAFIVRGESVAWRQTADGRLAEIIVLDQFSRNMFRGMPEAFAYDELALSRAREAITVGADKEVDPVRRHFFYMPYMHSESLAAHEEALPLFEALGNESALRYERLHKEQIERFGRYPHRNAVLGRESTPEELAFLEATPGF